MSSLPSDAPTEADVVYGVENSIEPVLGWLVIIRHRTDRTLLLDILAFRHSVTWVLGLITGLVFASWSPFPTVPTVPAVIVLAVLLLLAWRLVRPARAYIRLVGVDLDDPKRKE
jgi:multisubunit Na+/H+ antiporter MnhF subunit